MNPRPGSAGVLQWFDAAGQEAWAEDGEPTTAASRQLDMHDELESEAKSKTPRIADAG